MSKEKFERTNPHVNVDTVRHVNYDKTMLTAEPYQYQWVKHRWIGGIFKNSRCMHEQGKN